MARVARQGPWKHRHGASRASGKCRRRSGTGMSDPMLARLAAGAGILPDYWTLSGELRTTTPEIMRAVLEAMGIPATTSEDVRASLLAGARARWERILPAATVTRGEPAVITIPAALSEHEAQW